MTRSALLIGADRPFGAQILRVLEADGYAVSTRFADAPQRLDLLVVNAPAEPRGIRFRDLTDADFMAPFEAQLFDFVKAVQSATPRMSEGGSIVHVGSKAHLGTWDGAELAAAGAAAIGMARSMALELAAQGIRVNNVAPDYAGEKWDSREARIDVAETVVWLASPMSRAVNGETILANAGRSLQMRLAAKR